jgi:hypothetical protein
MVDQVEDDISECGHADDDRSDSCGEVVSDAEACDPVDDEVMMRIDPEVSETLGESEVLGVMHRCE